MYKVRIDTVNFQKIELQRYLKKEDIQTAVHPFSKTGTVTYFADEKVTLEKMIKAFFDRRFIKEIEQVKRRKYNEKHVA